MNSGEDRTTNNCSALHETYVGLVRSDRHRLSVASTAGVRQKFGFSKTCLCCYIFLQQKQLGARHCQMATATCGYRPTHSIPQFYVYVYFSELFTNLHLIVSDSDVKPVRGLVTQVLPYVFNKSEVSTAFRFWVNRRHVIDRRTDRRRRTECNTMRQTSNNAC